jgi:hypothetical protein
MGNTFREQWAAISAYLDFEATSLRPSGKPFDILDALEREAASAGWPSSLDALLDKRSGEVTPRLELIARAAATILEAKERHSRDRFSDRDVKVISAVVSQLLSISIGAEKRSREAGAASTNKKKAQEKAKKVTEYLELRKTRTRIEAILRMEWLHTDKAEKTKPGYFVNSLQTAIPSDKKLGLSKKP